VLIKRDPFAVNDDQANENSDQKQPARNGAIGLPDCDSNLNLRH